LPFIAFCGLSCSGNGFYALALIAEPGKLNDYAEHCFEILKTYEIIPDESKGKKVENLRYISYDGNMLIRENPEPLKIKHFKRKAQSENKNKFSSHSVNQVEINDKRISKLLAAIAQAQPGQRMSTISKYSFTLGGLGKPELLDSITAIIVNNSSFSDQESDFLKCAKKCFHAGSLKPIH